MLGEAIVTYMDILGYSNIVERFSDEQLIRNIENILKKSTVELLNDYIERLRVKPTLEKEQNEYAIKICNSINVRIISDSIIYTLPLSNITSTKDIDENSNIINYIEIYLNMISMFIPFFIAKTGLIVRGAISKGTHYESEFDCRGFNLFVFSKVLVNAVKLGEKNNKYPRIIIDDSLLSYMKQISFEKTDEYTYNDDDSKKCLDLYCFLRNDRKTEIVLDDIRKGISLNIQYSLKNNEDRIIDKLKYFVKYHNNRVNKSDINMGNMEIGMDVFKK